MNARIILLLLFLQTLVSAEVTLLKDTWLQGCYYDNGTSDQLETVQKMSLVACAGHCFHEGWQFAAIRNGLNCACLNETTTLHDANRDLCDKRCPDLDDVWLPCGGAAPEPDSPLWSVYRVDGPYLTDVSASVTSFWVVSGVPVTLQATAVLGRHSNLTDDVGDEDWVNDLSFQWTWSDQQVHVDLPASGHVTTARVPFVFPRTGNFSVDVRVTNALSDVRTQLLVTVVTPRPRGLQLLPAHRHPSDVPSCVHPSGLTSHDVIKGQEEDGGEEGSGSGQPLVVVFAGTALEVEADVTTGVNVTFVFSLSDGKGRVVHRAVAFPESGVCTTPACQEVRKRLVFPQTGRYYLHVNASNQYGWEERKLDVVAVDRSLGPARFTLLDASRSQWLTGQPLTFRLAVHTTDRHNTRLRVDFDDGHVGTASLRETADAETERARARRHAEECREGARGRREVVDEEGVEGLQLVANYGERCELIAEFHHTYLAEGEFAPRAWLNNNVTLLTQDLTEPPVPLLLLHQLSADELQAPEALAAGGTAEFFLRLLPASSFFRHLQVRWLISDDSGAAVANLTSPSPHLEWLFPRPGGFYVKAAASNPLSNVTASASLVVQEAVKGLTLSCQPDPPHLRVEQQLSCQAQLSTGSDVNISWNFEDPSSQTDVESEGLTSKATHVFMSPGRFNVSVQAANRVSRQVALLRAEVTVDAPVRCLKLETSGAAQPGEKIFLAATALGGTALRFDFDFGKSHRSHGRDGESSTLTRTTAETSVQFTRSGRHPVTVRAHNAISSVSLAAHMVVQQTVQGLQLVPHVVRAPNSSTIFLVLQKGKPTERQDLVYQLQFSDGSRLVSTSPVLEKVFTQTGNHGVNFTAFNEVDTHKEQFSLEVDDLDETSGKPRLEHQAIAILHHTVVFQILDFPRDVQKTEVRYSDGSSEVLRAGLSVWDHVFQSPGVHTLEVAIYGKKLGGVRRRGPTLHSVLVVEQPIEGLQLVGPAHVGIHCDNVWEAKVSGGSHLVCQWSTDEEQEGGFTTLLTHKAGFSAAGTYTLAVHCHNDISRTSATMNVTVSHPVSDVRLSVPVVVQGQNTTLTVTAYTSPHFLLQCDYGDGTIEQFDSRQLQLVSIEQQMPEWMEPVPAYNVPLSHRYTSTGAYNITVTVRNAISSISSHTVVEVKEAVGEIYLEVQPSGAISLSERVHVTAVVSSGNGLKFEWEFSGDLDNPPRVLSEGNTSIASKSFSKPGQYNVTVKVTNHHQKEPVTVRLPAPIVVQEPVTKVMLAQLGQPGANFSLVSNLSDEVTFEAKSYGEPVRFVFDFGDGHTQTVEGSMNPLLHIMEAKATHRYRREGVFTVTVTGSNELGNATASLSYPLYIQVPVRGPVLGSKSFCTHFGEEVVLTASPTQGTNVTYRWKLDDETELVNMSGTIRHKYRQPGLKTIEVTASNNVSNVTDFAFVDVVELIQSVAIQVDSKVVAQNQLVEFWAIVVPERSEGSSRYFVWNVNGMISDQKTEPHKTQQFSRSGRYGVSVTALNCYSNATSLPVEIHVVSPLVDLSIKPIGDFLVGQPIKFLASHYYGDFLNFTWSFGDSSTPVFTRHTAVLHTYNRTGEYKVTLLAENPLGHKEVTSTVFILTQVCKPPFVTIVGFSDTSNVTRWQPLHAESQVTVNCSVTGNILYDWKVMQLKDESGNETNALQLTSSQVALKYPELIIPSHSLPLGQYRLFLTVTMNGTEIPVYQETSTDFNLIRSPVVSHIWGGDMQLHSRHSTVTLSGSMSHDPDDSSALLSYEWGCQILGQKHTGCFNESSTHHLPPLNESWLQVPASVLLMDREHFLFNLTTRSPGSPPAYSTQVIQLSPSSHIIPIGIHCQHCHQIFVNANDKLSLVAVCGHDICTGKNLHYRWKVSDVPGGSPGDTLFSGAEARDTCQQADGTPYQRQVVAASNTSAIASQTSITSQTSTVATTTTTIATTTSRSTAAPPAVDVTSESQGSKDLNEDGFLPIPDLFPDPVEAHVGARVYSETSRRGQTSRISDRNHASYSVPIDISEGMSSERKIVPRLEEVSSTTVACLGPDCVIHNQPDLPTAPPHVVMKLRNPLTFPAASFLSEMDSPALVLRPGTLTPGRTYLVEVTVSSEDDPEATGLAMTTFQVNKGPSKGTCSVVPEAGVEMETLFKVFCKEWRDEEKHLPLWYSVRYTLDPNYPTSGTSDTVHHVLYYGLSHQVAFRLPAGLPHMDYRVLLELSVVDNLGAATVICHIPIQVRPRPHTSNATGAHHQLKHEAEQLSTRLSSSLFYGDTSGVEDAWEVLSNIAISLNRLTQFSEEEPAFQDVRYELVQAVDKVPIRDRVELVKTLQCLLYATQVTSQVNGEMLVKARGQMEKVAQQAQVLAKGPGSSEQDLLPLAVQVVSNLVQVATRGRLLYDADARTRHRVSARAIGALEDLLKVVLQDHALGELPFYYSTDFLATTAAHYNSFRPAVVNVSNASFRLPPGIAARRWDSRRNASDASSFPWSPCIQVHSMVFRHSPFLSAHAPLTEVQSQVVGLEVFTCGEQQRPLMVEGLSAEDNLEITLPLTEKVVAEGQFLLQRNRMSIHQFNVSQTQKDLYLSLLVTLDPIPPGTRPFPITAVISQQWPPHPEQCLYCRNFPLDADQLRLFFPPGHLNGTGTFYLGLVETSLNSGRRRKTEVEARHYAFKAWVSSCLFWNESESKWSSAGCQVMATTTPEAAQCRCSHLTSFGSHFELIPNDLSFADVEYFFSLHENPVVVVLLGVVLMVYIVLLVLAKRADKHDSRKGRLVCLADNNITDTQLYEVIVHTGLRQRGPTSAKISIILHGEYGMSETRELISEDDRPMFESNSRDRFLLTLPDSLGRIIKVQLWHNNAGPAPQWFLSQLFVRDLSNGKMYCFLCNSWLAVDEDDGRVEREFVATDGNVGFVQVALIKGYQYLWDMHLWASVITCPQRSCFTRVQRLTCCLTVLLSYMALNAMWYQQQPEQRRGEFGLLDLSWRSVAVGGICCGIVLPLNLFLAFLFRCSRVSHQSCDHRGDSSNRTSNLATTTTTTTAGVGAGLESSRVGEDVAVSSPSVTYSLLDQSILNWQSIQGWAQRQWIKRQQSSQSSTNSVKNNAQPPTQPCPTQPVQQTLHAGDETDQASSGFEDAVSQATAERNRVKATSDTSSDRHSPIAHLETGGRRIYLPSWCRYLAFILCAFICAGSGTVTVLYGFRFGPVKSMQWLQSLYFSFIICVFLAQPLLIILCVMWVAIHNHGNPSILDHYGDEEEAREGIEIWHSYQKQTLDSSEDEFERGVRARQRSRYLRFSRPPQEKRLQESRKRMLKEKKAANFLRELTTCIAIFTLVCVMAYGKDLSSHYLLNTSLEAMFLKTRPQSFHGVSSVKDWYLWAQGPLLDVLYGTHSSPGLAIKGGLGQNNFLIGQPYIRQLQEHRPSCPSLPYLSAEALCPPGGADLHSSSMYQWSPPPPGGSLTWGQIGVYQAGGYSVHLNHSSKEEAWSYLEDLKSGGWLDRRTRAVMVELTILNVPTNLFSSVVLLLELPATGSAIASFKVMSTCLFRYITTWDNCVLAYELLFVLVALVCVQNQLSAMLEQGHRYFLWLWNYMQMAFCLVSMVYVVFYIYRFVLVADVVEYMRSSFFEQFVSLAFVALWDELMRSLVGMLVFLVVLAKGLCLTQYWSPMAKFVAVYRRVRCEVLLMTVLFFGMVTAFSALGTSIFGTFLYSMRSVWSAYFTVVALATGIYKHSDLELEASVWYSVFTLLFSIIGCGLVTSYAVAVFTHRLRVYRNSEAVIIDRKDLLRYCWQQMVRLFCNPQVTPVHEPQVDLPPECTLAEFEYQVEELLFRMNALAGTTNLPEKPTGYLSDSDQPHANGDDGISSGESEIAQEHCAAAGVQGGETELVGEECGRLEQRVQKIEDKLYAHEPYLAQLLKLDSIGAHVLSQEKEKQLRSHLELEIFRRLQMGRQETDGAVQGAENLTQTNPVPAAVASVPTVAIDCLTEIPAKGFSISVKPSSPAFSLPHPVRSHQNEARLGPPVVSASPQRRTPSERDSKPPEVGAGESLQPGPRHADAKTAVRADAPDGSMLREVSGRAFAAAVNDDVTKCRPGFCHQRSKSSIVGGRFSAGPWVDSVHSSGPDHLSRPHTADRAGGGFERAGSLRVSSRQHRVGDLVSPVTEKTDCLHGSVKKHPADVPFTVVRADSLREASRRAVEAVSMGMERADSLRLSGKRHITDSGGHSVERADSLRLAGKKPELPPKPTFAQSKLPSLDNRHSPKATPLKLPMERALHKGELSCASPLAPGGAMCGSGHLGDSSSGSEPDTAHLPVGLGPGGIGRRPQGQGRRNLRKTKTRGKGKGSGTISPTLLLDELSLASQEPLPGEELSVSVQVHQPPMGHPDIADDAM